MNFSFDTQTFSVYHNIFAFFGTFNLKGFIESIDGRIFEKIKSEPKHLIGQKFSDMVLRRAATINSGKLETILQRAAVEGVKTFFEFHLSDEEKIHVELFLQPLFIRENRAERIFFGARETFIGETADRSNITDDGLTASNSIDIHEFERRAESEVEETNRAKDFFVAMVSHELRSPLNTILGWTKILLTRELNETARKAALETIEKSARKQAKLIDDLVDTTRILSSEYRLELRLTNLFEVVKSVCEARKSEAEAKQVNLEFIFDKENIQIYGDASRLQQVFTNLISRALKTAKSGESIKVEVQGDEDETKVFVKDGGAGISPETLPHIFRQFHSGGEKTSVSGAGLGLELPIVKTLVEKHNGKVYAESEGVGYGSTFTVIFPTATDNKPDNAAD